ncbi:glycosyltransferase [Macrococcus equi]|uniref:glycosyltransferase n=1 Tax=Macrococcus equi TaxID=3395462 RepID=UPI0039BDDE7D
MKIAIIVSSNIVKDPRVVKEAEIAKSITDDYIVIGKYDENATKSRLSKLNFNYQLIKVKTGNTIISKALSRIRFGLKLIKAVKKYNPDVIHANDFDMLFFSYFFKKPNQILIFDAHEIYAKNGMIAKSALLSKLVEKAEKKMLSKVDHFITVSHAAKTYYQSRKYPKEATVITNVPIKKEISVIEKSHNFQVLYQGIVSEGRGYEEFAQAAEFVDKNIELVVRGYGPTMPEIENLKIKKQLSNLLIEDPVEMDEMIRVATSSHVGVVMTKPISANYEYTISNKFFEYLHAGLPLILSPVKEHKYLNDKFHVGIIVDQVTPEAIAEAANKLYKDAQFYSTLKSNVQKASEQLNWQKESEKLRQYYQGNNYEK